VAADTIGVSAEELRQAVDGGQTIAQVAQQHGVDPQQAVDAVVQAATTKLDEAVAAGTIPAARADALKAKLPERATRLVNETGQHRGERTERRARRQAAIDAAAKELGVSSEQLRDALQAGRAAAGQS
jgi:transposase-like protein